MYREKVQNLCRALESQESRVSAVEAIRALVETILLEPDGDHLKITLKGDLAGMPDAVQRQQEVARYRRPLGPNKTGCGGVQPAVLAAVAKRRLTDRFRIRDQARCRSMNSSATQIE